MSFLKSLMTAGLVGVVVAGAACTERTTSEGKKDADIALDATTKGADKAVDATKQAGSDAVDAAKKAAGKTSEFADQVVEKSKEALTVAGAKMTDRWITTKLKAKFADETILKGSDISVDTSDHVVTLSGTVPSTAAKARAAVIARGTDDVTRVVDRLATP